MSIHHRNLQLLATEIFKTQRNLNPNFMNKLFDGDTPYTFRSDRNVLAPEPSTTEYDIENARFLRAKMWCTMLSSFKEFQTLNSFKRCIKTINLIAAVDCEKNLLKI